MVFGVDLVVGRGRVIAGSVLQSIIEDILCQKVTIFYCAVFGDIPTSMTID